ncbi:hypothetical protein NIES267_47920 [Calothrix parasitica NIES-267]|uniref:Uncharacterized protein n=1 Tax=Calothrix parasitica NIES-267 TaxID=1973488 RepID=A0A1Z4LVQ1_9CYAN|nr:hypothetical protein NIES267_47920 [Calothrix parasitica NIES-267]
MMEMVSHPRAEVPSVEGSGATRRGRWGDGEMGRWGDGEMGRWGDGEMGRWGDYVEKSEGKSHTSYSLLITHYSLLLTPKLFTD